MARLVYSHTNMFRAFATILLVSTLVRAAGPITTQDIPRFQMVSEGFYRGGQPEKEGFEFLKQQGFKTIINLRQENDEEPIVRGLGLNYVHIPMSITVGSRIPDA